MIQLNLAAILNDREIKKHCTYLVQNGFSWDFASRMLTHKTKSITFAQLEKLCTLLHCTPNDILVWTPNENEKPSANQPLHQIIQPQHRQLISHGFKTLPIEKLREIRKIIEEEVKKNL
ncbi:MAG: helix-turn-helix transcriptional regulator [Chitinophagales bacterium]